MERFSLSRGIDQNTNEMNEYQQRIYGGINFENQERLYQKSGQSPDYAGYTMAEAVELLSTEYGWSDSLSNFSAKLRRESLRYKDVLELADVLGYEIVWQKGRDRE